MKKLFLFFCFCSAVNAVLSQCPKDTVIVDTLHYYFNKYYFRTAQTNYSNFPVYKSAAATVTNMSHCGSRFENVDPNLTITGLEAFACLTPQTMLDQAPVHLFLYKIDPLTGLPEPLAIDSVAAIVNSEQPRIVGGNFENNRTYKMSGDFAVLIRNMSTHSGDTVQILRTNGVTATNTAAGPQQKMSEGKYGFIRYNGQFYSTQNFTLHAGFGYGTDYEFMVAPRVTYTLTANHSVDKKILDFNNGVTPDTICARTPFTFGNLSSYQYTNRFYNLIEFYRKWNTYLPFPSSVKGAFSNDSAAISWNFEYYENTVPPQDSRRFLAYKHQGLNHGTILSATDRPGCFNTNEFRARLKPMNPFGRGKLFGFNCNFEVCLRLCDGDGVGLPQSGNDKNIVISPNPLKDGITRISGLSGTNTVTVYDIFGQLILQLASQETAINVDLQDKPEGTYIIHLTRTNELYKVIKVLR